MIAPLQSATRQSVTSDALLTKESELALPMASKNLPPSQSPSNHIPILAVLAGLIEGNLAAYEALDQLTTLNAPDYLIQSVRQIEAMFGPRDPDYCGPMDWTGRGAA